MDLRQQKLTSEEWDALERPVNKEEHRILQMINQGYLNAKLVRHHWKNCLNEKNSSHYKIWNVLMFQSWHRDFFNK